ncbi:MAG: hypothetical protein ACPG4X_15850 [Pikeienuella sp.]
MDENLNEAISVEDAASLMFEEPKAATPEDDDVTDEVETDEESDTEELEADESEADDGQTDEEDEGDEEAEEVEEEDTDEDDDDPVFEIDTVNGKQEVSLSDLTAGYMRQSDYTKKTMELAEQRKAFEGQNQEVSQIKQQLSQALEYWAVPMEQEPNWATIAQERTPQEVFALQQEWGERQKRKEQALQHHQALQAHELQRVREKETEKLLNAFPEWRNPEVFDQASQRVREFGGNYGFSADEMASLVDHRMVRVLEDARKYREIQAAKPKLTKKVTKAAKKMKPGSKPDKAEQAKAARQKKLDRLKQSGSVNDAVDLLLGE